MKRFVAVTLWEQDRERGNDAPEPAAREVNARLAIVQFVVRTPYFTENWPSSGGDDRVALFGKTKHTQDRKEVRFAQRVS